MHSRYGLLGGLAAAFAACFATAFLVESRDAAEVLLVVGLAPLSFGGVGLPIRAGVIALRSRRSVVRPVLLTTVSLCAGQTIGLFGVLATGDQFGRFSAVRAAEFGSASASGIHLALTVSGQLAVTASITTVLVVVVGAPCSCSRAGALWLIDV